MTTKARPVVGDGGPDGQNDPAPSSKGSRLRVRNPDHLLSKQVLQHRMLSYHSKVPDSIQHLATVGQPRGQQTGHFVVRADPPICDASSTA